MRDYNQLRRALKAQAHTNKPHYLVVYCNGSDAEQVIGALHKTKPLSLWEYRTPSQLNPATDRSPPPLFLTLPLDLRTCIYDLLEVSTTISNESQLAPLLPYGGRVCRQIDSELKAYWAKYLKDKAREISVKVHNLAFGNLLRFVQRNPPSLLLIHVTLSVSSRDPQYPLVLKRWANEVDRNATLSGVERRYCILSDARQQSHEAAAGDITRAQPWAARHDIIDDIGGTEGKIEVLRICRTFMNEALARSVIDKNREKHRHARSLRAMGMHSS